MVGLQLFPSLFVECSKSFSEFKLLELPLLRCIVEDGLGQGSMLLFFNTIIMVIVIIIMVISIIFFLVSVKIQYILYRSLYSSSLPLDPILASPPDIIRLTEHNHSDQIKTTQPQPQPLTTTQIKSQNPKSCHLGYNQSLIN